MPKVAKKLPDNPHAGVNRRVCNQFLLDSRHFKEKIISNKFLSEFFDDLNGRSVIKNHRQTTHLRHKTGVNVSGMYHNSFREANKLFVHLKISTMK